VFTVASEVGTGYVSNTSRKKRVFPSPKLSDILGAALPPMQLVLGFIPGSTANGAWNWPLTSIFN